MEETIEFFLGPILVIAWAFVIVFVLNVDYFVDAEQPMICDICHPSN